MGVRVVPLPDERPGIEARAAELGVRFPFDGGALRLVMGACVFYDAGCRLHAAFGVEAKPMVCQQFPWVRRGGAVGVDPACGHAGAWGASPEAPLLGVDADLRPELAAGDLAALSAGLGLTLAQVGHTWRTMPWAAWSDQGTAGPLRREGSARLARLPTPDAWPSWPAGAEAVRRAWRLGLTEHPADLLVGATVIAHGVHDDDERQRLLAVWVRSLR